MNANLYQRIATIWIIAATEELDAALDALTRPDVWPARFVVYHLQQAVEKAVKAALIFGRTGRFEATRDLVLLVRALPNDGSWTTRSPYPNLGPLSVHAAESRYLANNAPVTRREAERAARLATNVVRSILQDMTAHGFTHQSFRRPCPRPAKVDVAACDIDPRVVAPLPLPKKTGSAPGIARSESHVYARQRSVQQWGALYRHRPGWIVVRPGLCASSSDRRATT